MAGGIPADALVALGAAAAWGGGDFCGGMGVKAAQRADRGQTASALRVVITAHAVSLAVLLVALAGAGRVWPPAVWPHGALLGWGLAAGVGVGGAVTAFYIALSRGAMGASAALSGLLAAAIPALVSGVIEGAPTALRVVGFVMAAVAIWMIAAGPSPENVQGAGGPGEARTTTALAVLAGVGFGFYFVALRMDNPLGALEPTALARMGSVATCAVLLGVVGLRTGKLPVQPMSENPDMGHPDRGWWRRGWLSWTAVRWALGVAVLDTGGNLLFIWATRMGRLDVAAVLASLYPASTILLAAWRLHERPTRRQIVGMSVALAAVVMITV